MPTAPTSNLPLVRPGISVAEYQARRERVLKSLNGSAAIVLSGDGGGHGGGAFKADSHFVYLTGITTEPGAAVLFNPQSEDPRRRIVLFLKPLNPELERWDRYRDPISAQMKSAAGFEVVMRTDSLPMLINTAARRCKKFACLHSFGTGGPGADLQLYRKVAERVVGVSIEDRTMLLNEMRSIKSKAELAIMRQAAEATAAGYAAVLELFKSKKAKTEKQVERTLTATYLDQGADGGGHAYEPIVGSGLNATVLHYRDNAGPLTPGDLLLIDSGCQFQGYACDVTRTFPVSGRFSPEQKKIYQVVLDAQLAAIKKAMPGAYIWELDKAARDIIETAHGGAYKDAYIHGIGHHLGMDVHDATPDGKLQPGMVITIEPGIYLPEKNLGIRIEDDILITGKGNENLTKMIPKTIEAIEAAMR